MKQQISNLLNRLKVSGAATAQAAWRTKALRLVLEVTAVILVSYFFFTCLKPTPKDPYFEEMRAWKARAAIAEQENDRLKIEGVKTVAFVDSINTVVAKKDQKIATLTATATNMRKKNDSLMTTLSQTLPDTCKPALDLANQYKSEADMWKGSFQVASEQVLALKLSVDTLTNYNVKLRDQNTRLDSLLNAVPEKKPERFLGFIPLPSRTASFLIGGAIGVIGTVTAVVAVK